jgi:pimeloyl-ACP methyl ester carboxylesterase
MAQAREEAFFFENEGAYLYGMLHLPSHGNQAEEPRPNVGLVFCHAFADEAFRTHREMVVFARVLARQGYAVFRFDCRGCGDSEGDFASATLSSHLSDIRRAVDIIITKCEIGTVGLLGLRFGGALAAAAAGQDQRVSSLILWAPVIDGASYFQFLLKSQMVHELGNFGKVISSRRGIVQGLESGGTFDLMANKISHRLYQELKHFHPWQAATYVPEHVAVIALSGDKTNPRDLELIKEAYPSSQIFLIREKHFWYDKIFQNPSTLYNTTLNWLQGI